TNELMHSCDTILATGGPGMVTAAYSSGKPALGVGPGNNPAIIDDSADVELSVNSIIHSKTFDYGMICATEQNVIVLDKVYDAVKAEFQKRGCYFLKKDEAEKAKEEVAKINERLAALEPREAEITARIREIMLTIPQIMDPSVPIGKDDSCNVEIQRYGEPVVPDFEIPYHTDIMERLHGIDLEAAGKVAGNGFYYLLGDIARLHSAVLSYARDFMIDRGFTYVIPPYMIHSDVVTGVMSFPEMDAMMYKIEGEDLYLIGTSEHSMIGRFIDSVNDEAKLPYTLTSYSPCFRKEKGAHGIEERGVYRIHQFEKQEMIVICKPEESMDWYNKLWQNTVDFFRSLDIPVRTLECCSGDLADLKVKSCDVEAWSPRQKKYFEVGSCSNLGDAQARRLRIRVKGADGKKYLAHTLNNTCVAPPRMLIAFLENNLQADGSVRIPEALRSYMGGKSELRA
ncbi:MAG: serine--tRNA ligase, partial [Stomatobaculum longum]